ncbi:MAG: ImmA/IrrE family metallo-endopeptidase [Chloroflexota bacterium]
MVSAGSGSTGVPGRLNTQAWASLLIERIAANVREALASDPKRALAQHFNLQLRAVATVSARGFGGSCDGLSILTGRVILYRSTPGSRRENFTLLHELGHFLVGASVELLSWAADQQNPSRAIEEVCDRVAAGLLLPAPFVDGMLKDSRPEAAHLMALFGDSVASREVCTIALSQRLGCEGFVALVSRGLWQVTFASRVAETWPHPWRGDPIPPDHPLQKVAANGAKRCEAWWASLNGERRDYYMDAVADEQYVYSIFAATDLWKIASLHIQATPPMRPTTFSRIVHCSSCGYQGTTSQYPCSECGQPYCPQCGECECNRRARHSGVCKVCRCIVPSRRLTDGICNDCLPRVRRR